MAPAEDESSEENILYNLTVHAEWKVDAEPFYRPQKDSKELSIWNKLTSASQRSLWNILKNIGIPFKSGLPCSLPAGLVQIVNSQLAWNIAVGKFGQLVAILQDQFIEIRSSHDDYNNIIGRSCVMPDTCPQWRQIAWSSDGALLAVSHSNGIIEIFDMFGNPLFSIPSVTETSSSNVGVPTDLTHSVAGLVFLENTKVKDGTAHLLVVNYLGKLSKYHVDRNSTYRLLHTFMLTSEHPQGVTGLVYLPQHSALIVGSHAPVAAGLDDSMSQAEQYGLSLWRILSDSPHYKLVTDYEQDLHKSKPKSFLKKLFLLPKLSWKNSKDSIFKMCLSPDTKQLVTLHYSGELVLWDVPSLRKRKSWLHEDQPGYDDISQEFLENPYKKKFLKDLVPSKNLIDINWWSENALILARCPGAVSLVSTNTLKNLLGAHPEWFEPSPRVTSTYEGRFLGLECSCRFVSKRHALAQNSSGSSSDDELFEDSDDDEDISWMRKTSQYTKQVLYYVTDNERFQPLRKKPKLVNRTYQLVCLRSTTPEELYAQKIDNEEYGEALALAKAYGLDCDLVYQRQWQKSPVSIASIEDYLRKISKRSWVLHECLERVPETINALRELMEYGLKGTDLQAMIAIAKREDGGRLVMCDDEDLIYDSDEEEDYDPFSPLCIQRRQDKIFQRREELLNQIDFQSLLLEQKELCRARLKLLQYLYRLRTYELILGGIHVAQERFDKVFFETFRSGNIVEEAIKFAQDSEVVAVEALFTYHGSAVLPHRLAILSNFPETTSPREYSNLLPEVGLSGMVFPWEEDRWRDDDWCEAEDCRCAVDIQYLDLGLNLYEEYPHLLKYKGLSHRESVLTQWYVERACEIELESRMVDNSVELIKIGIERGVPGLEDLLNDLLTMDCLVYDCHIDCGLSFQQLQNMSNIQKAHLLMSKSSVEKYIKNIYSWLIPFLKRCEKNDPHAYMNLLKQYLMDVAKEDITLPLKVFEASKSNLSSQIISNPADKIQMAVDVLYICERDDQLNKAESIIKCLPNKIQGPGSYIQDLHKQKERLESHIWAAKIFEENGLKQTIYSIKLSQESETAARNMLVKLTRAAGRRTPRLNEKGWISLHANVMHLQEKLFNQISVAETLEIFVASLLCSSNLDTIRLAKNYIARKHGDSRSSQGDGFIKVPFERTVKLVLSASQEYFNSALDLSHFSMEMAQSCLNLVEETSVAIQEELDLIEALSILGEFEITVLPLQLRLEKNRLKYVEAALNSRSNSYQLSDKLLQLAKLLRVSVDDAEIEGQVYKLIAEKALDAKDYMKAYYACSQLMEKSYPPAWSVCVDLSQNGNCVLGTRIELLEFALTYCDPDQIQSILDAKALIDIQMLYDQVCAEFGTMSSSDEKPSSMIDSTISDSGVSDFFTPEQSPQTSMHVLNQTKDILLSTGELTKGMLSSVTDVKWWHHTIHNLVKMVPVQRLNSNKEQFTDEQIWNFENQACHPFYGEIIENCVVDKKIANFETFEHQVPALVETSDIVLRTAKLKETLTEGKEYMPATEVLLKLAGATITTDFSLGLAYLLALPNIEDADQCFSQLPNTTLSIQLAKYYYSIQLYNYMSPQIVGRMADVFKHPPRVVVETVEEFLSHNPTLPADIQKCVERLNYYKNLIKDHAQARFLRGLGRGVDIQRFTEDNAYKHETILGLAMTTEADVFTIAISLAERYNLSQWEVYMTHLEFLFCESGLNTNILMKRVESASLMPTLLENYEQFIQRMQDYVYPFIDGQDHSRLTYYYSLLSKNETEHWWGEDLKPSVHVNLLKKLRPVAAGLDYKLLMTSEDPLVTVIQPILSKDNVNTIAKLSSRIPCKTGGFIRPGMVYSIWAAKSFWRSKETRSKLSGDAYWLQQYDDCLEFTQKMIPAEFLTFVESITFVLASREKLTLNCRENILKKALKYCHQDEGKKKKKQDDSKCDVTWIMAADTIEGYLEHLRSQNNPVIDTLKSSDDTSMKQYAKQFDLSMGNIEQIKKLHIQILVDGHPLELIDEILSVKSIKDWNTAAVVQNALVYTTEYICDKTCHSDIFDKLDGISVIEGIIQNVLSHQEMGGQLVTADEVLMQVLPFCSDTSIAVQPRLGLLATLEKNFKLKPEDVKLLLFYRTSAIIEESWPNHKITDDEIQSDESRHKLFTNLLSSSTNSGQFTAVCQLLKMWPAFECSSNQNNASDNPWIQLVTSMSTVPECVPVIGTILKDIPEEAALSEECVKFIVDQLLSKNYVVAAVKTALLSPYSHLHKSTIEHLQAQKEMEDDNELYNLILLNHLMSSTVNSCYYQPLVNFLLNEQVLYQDSLLPSHLDIDLICQELIDNGFKAEAGLVLLKSHGTHPMFQTFEAALGVCKHWLKM
ncbi:neuroblastoma-amplified sequence-like [Octopus vulgaris]|uniref:Neuroblastoma-amplified sequence-like n=1 Tax=Octopus vulgaris TaxID=6645 RepID=A0AA36BHH5_OCTVU|nr:neuroblastoma-amplified sequence-like [Octopus vulgaris]